MRSEQTIFDDLATLCISKGYIHALAHICFRDNFIGIADELTVEDMAKNYSWSRLIRSEITTLIGLMMRSPIDFSLPAISLLSSHVQQSDALLSELHKTMYTAIDFSGSNNPTGPETNPFSSGEVLREPIFYSAESAYSSQYRDLAPRKYYADTEWLAKKKDFRLEIGREVCKGLADILERRSIETLRGFENKPAEEWNMLPAFVFSCEELATFIDHRIDVVRAFVEAFTLPQDNGNAEFTSLNAFNTAYAYPFIRKGPDEYVLLQYFGLTEAFYETPYYWMCDDDTYRQTAFHHRGEFTEAFAAERLSQVFGTDRVFQNVEIRKPTGQILGEIDVLAIFGNRAIVLQAKSKKLTLEARKGNDRQLQEDFKKAVQDAVDQSFKCAESLGDPSITLRCPNGHIISLAETPQTIFPITIVSDHYPALAFQARQFLQSKFNERVVSPLVTDVFALDTISEMLTSPLRFLSYLGLRTRHGDKLLANHENVLLSLHLKQNLWLESNLDFVMVTDDVSASLDVAMAVRRDGMPGAATPDGILTRFEGTPFSRIIAEIEDRSETAAIDLGFMLLELGEDTVRAINEYISGVLQRTAADGELHNAVIGISEARTGLTVHCSRMPDREAEDTLRQHCEIRKYSQKANNWFGLALWPDGSIRMVAELLGDWRFDRRMETLMMEREQRKVRNMTRKSKIGRNDPCPCGSGKKYKRCCIGR